MYKVFGIGWCKTGTTTLERALNVLGVTPSSGWTQSHALIPAWVANDISSILQHAENYRSFVEAPWNWGTLYQRLDETFPGSKFVLTTRHPDKWFSSLTRWLTPYGRNVSDIRSRPYGEIFHCGIFDCQGFSFENQEDKYKAIYKQHNQQVETYFKDRPNDLLVVNWEQGAGWGDLCSFLKTPVPNEPFPHLNKQ